ncbi:hypothetical protein SARC_12066, partial [Sphaeroforma arctica JP610]
MENIPLDRSIITVIAGTRRSYFGCGLTATSRVGKGGGLLIEHTNTDITHTSSTSGPHAPNYEMGLREG